MTGSSKFNIAAALGTVALAALSAGCATSGASQYASYRPSGPNMGADRLYRDNFVENTVSHSTPDSTPYYAGTPSPRALAAFDGIAGARRAHELYPEDVAEKLDGNCEPRVKLLGGETLYDIERFCDVSLTEILAYNPKFRNARHVRAGAELDIPQNPNPERAAYMAQMFDTPGQPFVGAVAYVVQPGDSLNTIAGRHLVSAAAIANANPRIDWRFTPVGETVWIPAAGGAGNQVFGAPSLPTAPPQPEATSGSLPYNFGGAHSSASGLVYDPTGIMPYQMTPPQKAAESQAPRSKLSVSRGTVEPGGNVELSGIGLTRNADVDIYVGSNGSDLTYLKTVRTKEDGSFTETVTVGKKGETDIGGVIFEATDSGDVDKRYQSPRVGVAK